MIKLFPALTKQKLGIILTQIAADEICKFAQMIRFRSMLALNVAFENAPL